LTVIMAYLEMMLECIQYPYCCVLWISDNKIPLYPNMDDGQTYSKQGFYLSNSTQWQIYVLKIDGSFDEGGADFA
jgi:hypothetical protein